MKMATEADVDRLHFRLVLLGSNGTGKTSILNRFLFKKFEPKCKPTVEDLFTKTFDLGSVEIKVDFLDTSGSMQFPAMRRLSISTGSAFLIVYAVDDARSYDVLKNCVQEIQEIRAADYQELPIVFAGNKCDIAREHRQVLKETVSNYVHYELATRLRAKVIECSCKDDINIEAIFRAYLSLAKVTLSSKLGARLSATLSDSSAMRTTTTTSLYPNNNNNIKHTPVHALSSAPTTRDHHIVIAGAAAAAAHNSDDQCSSPPLSSPPPPHDDALKNPIGSRRSASLKGILGGVRRNNDAPVQATRTASFRLRNKDNNIDNAPTLITTANKQSDAAQSQWPNTKQQQQQHENHDITQLMSEVNLETAIKRSNLEVKQCAKPRSRSLIWRPSRKAKSNSEQSSDCRVT